MKKRSLSILLLALAISFVFAMPIIAAQPFVYLESGAKLEMVFSDGEVYLLEAKILDDVSGEFVLEIQTDCQSISPFQTICCDVHRPVQVWGRLYINGQHVGYGWIQRCAGCGRAWPL